MTDTTELVARFNAYFVSGGLFNPELANHAAVSEFVRDSRDAIERLTRERDNAVRLGKAGAYKANPEYTWAGWAADRQKELAAAEARIAKLEAALDSLLRDQHGRL